MPEPNESTRAAADFEHDVALSFAGEDREHAEVLAELLRASGVSVFYDKYEQAALWGKELTEELHAVYSKRARFFVPFISRHYAQKAWPRQEMRSALERAIQQIDSEYILPIRIDDTDLPGLRSTISYVPIEVGVERIHELLLEKLRGGPKSTPSPQRAPAAPATDLQSSHPGPAVPPADPDAGALERVRHWQAESDKRFEHLRQNERADQDPDRYDDETWSMAYGLVGDFRPIPVLQLPQVMRQATWYPRSWPLLLDAPPRGWEPRVFHGTYECWLGRNPCASGWLSHFWRASPDGRMYLRRGYWEDQEAATSKHIQPCPPSVTSAQPGVALYMEQPIRCVGAALLHAQSLALGLTGSAQKVVALFRWDGLKEREVQRDPATGVPWVIKRELYQDTVESTVIVPSTDELNGGGLAHWVAEGIRPWYEACEIDVDDPNVRDLIRRELESLLLDR
jgi:hypothetical protein